MFNLSFEKQQDTVNVEGIKNILAIRAELKESPDISYVINQINDDFDEALESKDRNKIKIFLESIKRYKEYLAEKYCNTEEEVEYIKTVNQAIDLLGKKLKAITSFN